MKTAIKMVLAGLALALLMESPTLAQTPTQKPKEWTFDTEVLFLHRNQNIRKGLATAQTSDVSKIVIGANDLKFGFRPGARFTLGYHPDAMNTFEAVYFGLQNWSAGKSTDCPKLGLARETGEGFTDCLNAFFVQPEQEHLYPGVFNEIMPEFNGVDALSVRYQSKLHNVELNYKRHFMPGGSFVPTLLAGFRFLSVPENFSLRVKDLGISPDDPCTLGVNCDSGAYTIHTTNHLFGAQVGGDGTFRWGVVEVGLRAKVGLFANNAKQRSSVCETTEGCGSTKKSGTNVAGVAEAGLFATWNVIENLALTAGYQILYVTGLALAPNQLASSSNPRALFNLDTSGNIFYHGPSVGARVSW